MDVGVGVRSGVEMSADGVVVPAREEEDECTSGEEEDGS